MSKRRGIPFVFTFEDMAGVVGDAVKTLAQLAARTFCPCLGQRTLCERENPPDCPARWPLS